MTNIDNSSVISVMDGRTEESLGSFLGAMDESQRGAITVAAMDMWPAYINAVKQNLPNAKIAFDRFHIASHLGAAVNTVRKEEHRELLAEGDATLTKTKFVWLQKPNTMKRKRRMLLTRLIDSSLRTARAWNEWIGWTKNCKLEPMIRAAAMVQKHLWTQSSTQSCSRRPMRWSNR